MKRREFVGRLGLGSAAILAGGAVVGAEEKVGAKQGHDHTQVTGPLASATVSFGQWKTPLDRHTGATPPPTNQHLLIPYEVQIKAGGSVNFIISGLHQVGIYLPGTELADINAGMIQLPATAPPTINDINGRFYRGISPFLMPQDRIEVVTIMEPGRYLVVCLVVPHFVNDKMHGYVNVLA
jgi:hypothetical protein